MSKALVKPYKLVANTVVLIFSGLLIISACHRPAAQPGGSEKMQFDDRFTNILDVSGSPVSKDDNSLSSFSDLGSWHSYAIPQKPKGGFSGPFIMTLNNGAWFGSLSDLSIFINGHYQAYDGATHFNYAYYPGRLEQHYEVAPLSVDQKLIFISAATALIQTTITNLSEKTLPVDLKWTGDTWLKGVRASRYHGGVDYQLPNNQHLVVQPSVKVSVNIDSARYTMTSSVQQLPGHGSIAFYVAHTLGDSDSVIEAQQPFISKAFQHPEEYFVLNKVRWKSYVTSVIDGIYDTTRQLLAVKALETLTNNWRAASGELKHQGFFPSYAYKGFYGFWSWDSWKHAVAAVKFNPEVAKDQIRAMYDYQDEKGMIADCIFRDTTIEANNWRDTKPPLSGWAIYEVFKATGDTAFVREMYPKLERYHQWWYSYRDHDHNGLCEYGSTDGTLIAAAWESGMDNAVRFDNARLLKNADGAWSVDQESVDLNAYLYAEKGYMARLAEVIGKPVDRLIKEAEELKDKLNQTFFDRESGYYYDVKLGTQSKIKIKGPEGWIPLWSGVATKEQAASVLKQIMDTTTFNTYMPFPTLDASHPEFNPQKGYWRGPVWLDQAYFAISGLQRYDFDQEADMLTDKLLHHAGGLLEKGEPIYENYHPLSGEGLNARHFSWSAAHILLMLKEEN